jgi:hypothetical protein
MLSSVPDFPAFVDVSLELSSGLGPFLRALAPPISEFTFTNLYLFRRAHDYRVSKLGGLLLVRARGYDGTPYAFPPLGEGNVSEAAFRLCDVLAAEGAAPLIFPVPASTLAAHFAAGGWVATGDRDQADYVYLREELATLPGAKFHKRKNRLLKFLREEGEGYAYAPLGAEHVEECRRLASGWCEIRCSLDRPSTYLETEAAVDALVHRDELSLKGGVILLAGQVAAFSLGEELNDDTFVVHFEKAEAGREGLAQLISRDFCLRDLGQYTYVNREQDLGDPGLRQAKQSYRPVALAEKYRLCPE